MGRRYKNPPIIEALCEFLFEPSEPWDLAIPGLLYEQVRNIFNKRRLVRTIESSIHGVPEGIEQHVRVTDRMHFISDDEKTLIQVGPNLLTVNRLKPYSSWQEFLPLIQLGFNAYLKVANPKGVQRVGLRYINRIEIPIQQLNLEDYFELRPFVGATLPRDFVSFIVGIHVAYENSRDVLRLQITDATRKTQDMIAIILDIDYFLAQPEQVPLDKVLDWVEIAHSRVEEAFEASITDQLRQMFEEVKEK